MNTQHSMVDVFEWCHTSFIFGLHKLHKNQILQVSTSSKESAQQWSGEILKELHYRTKVQNCICHPHWMILLHLTATNAKALHIPQQIIYFQVREVNNHIHHCVMEPQSPPPTPESDGWWCWCIICFVLAFKRLAHLWDVNISNCAKTTITLKHRGWKYAFRTWKEKSQAGSIPYLNAVNTNTIVFEQRLCVPP